VKTYTRFGLLALSAVLVGAACQSAQTNSNTGVSNNANTASANTANAAAPATAPSSGSPVDASSPIAAYNAAYNARKNKDIEALKKLFSKYIIEFFELIGKEENKSVDDMLRELTERPQADTAEARNEKINGDKATIEYLDEEGKWRPMDFVKEDGMWKLTLAVGDPEVETSGNSNK
jgi:predicted lipid-binding transport protein (Tim44 family)